MTDIYTKDLLRWTLKIPFQERMESPDASVVKTSRICGSRISLDVTFGPDGTINGAGWEVKACALGQATAAMVGQHIIGLGKAEFDEIDQLFASLVKGEDVHFPDKWQDLQALAPVKDHPGRQGSVALPFDCLRAVFAA
ncbi:iron-sulfur cluster assembly scaffold protein [Kordiimonas sediminis]|uniref:Iron-sulfur cluster assembly scaffold protein n=1 Tax=Kordiimonas sediminis TaxID=1735581 RepID=A0A919APM8_9PROT|nr:iron-sulfur cluster assembly scaffold protein [Kordiimonas sediminis]GHF17239.1 iron-sulfur cluster assembly scaffold protein [Kordiimonas sediminis]